MNNTNKTNFLRRPLAIPQGGRLGKTVMKVALVHDYIKGEGGAEQVLLTLHEMFPEAPIYTIFSNIGRGKNTNFEQKYAGAKIITSWFDKLPYREKLMSPLRFLLPVIWGSFNFSEFDLIISSASWAITKGFTTQMDQRGKKYQKHQRESPTSLKLRGALREICYCHTPPRILYGYETSRNWKKYWYIRIYALITNHFLRQYDFRRAQKVTQFVANSKVVQDRIRKFYRRESVIINPPVDIIKFKNQNAKIKTTIQKSKFKDGIYIDSGVRRNDKEENRYFLAGGRLEMPKNFDKIILACNQLKVQLKVYGSGPQMDYLKSIAGPTVELLGGVNDEEKIELYQNCKAYITAAVDEDFGITPVEAMAAGRPVIAFKGGGYLETVIEGKTGIFFEEATTEGLTRAIREFGKIGDKIKSQDCVEQAGKFSKKSFIDKMNKLINSLIKEE